jgi:hypothetical protein
MVCICQCSSSAIYCKGYEGACTYIRGRSMWKRLVTWVLQEACDGWKVRVVNLIPVCFSSPVHFSCLTLRQRNTDKQYTEGRTVCTVLLFSCLPLTSLFSLLTLCSRFHYLVSLSASTLFSDIRFMSPLFLLLILSLLCSRIWWITAPDPFCFIKEILYKKRHSCWRIRK